MDQVAALTPARRRSPTALNILQLAYHFLSQLEPARHIFVPVTLAASGGDSVLSSANSEFCRTNSGRINQDLGSLHA